MPGILKTAGMIAKTSFLLSFTRYLIILLIASLVMNGCRKGYKEETVEESFEESVEESVEQGSIMLMEKILEVDRALEVCIRKLEACAGTTVPDSVRTGLELDSLELEDLSYDELELLIDMGLPQLRAGLEHCAQRLSDCKGEDGKAGQLEASEVSDVPLSLPD
jgi:hypothetical protein